MLVRSEKDEIAMAKVTAMGLAPGAKRNILNKSLINKSRIQYEFVFDAQTYILFTSAFEVSRWQPIDKRAQRAMGLISGLQF